jgi:hypothetical protein
MSNSTEVSQNVTDDKVIAEVIKEDHAKRPGVYILVGDLAEETVYIGEADPVSVRLKQHLQKNGYMYVRFRLNGKKVKLYVHRIVATCFIHDPNNYPQVNHKDNDPTNNVVSNLEWCTNQYNQDYKNNFGTSPAQIFGRPVIAINLETSEIFWFKTQTEAAHQLVANLGHINEVIKGKLNKTGGYWFAYADNTAVEKTRAKFGGEMANKVRELMSVHL